MTTHLHNTLHSSINRMPIYGDVSGRWLDSCGLALTSAVCGEDASSLPVAVPLQAEVTAMARVTV